MKVRKKVVSQAKAVGVLVLDLHEGGEGQEIVPTV